MMGRCYYCPLRLNMECVRGLLLQCVWGLCLSVWWGLCLTVCCVLEYSDIFLETTPTNVDHIPKCNVYKNSVFAINEIIFNFSWGFERLRPLLPPLFLLPCNILMQLLQSSHWMITWNIQYVCRNRVNSTPIIVCLKW